jgi:hypothetical protein
MILTVTRRRVSQPMRDAQKRAGHHVDQQFAVEHAAPGPQRRDVHDAQDRQQNGGGLHRRDDQRHQRHTDKADAAGKAALGQADKNHRRNGGSVEPGIGDEDHAKVSWHRA